MPIKSKIYYIDSNEDSTVDNDDHSEFIHELNLKEFGRQPDKCAVLQAVIPKSYYAVQDGYNTFTLDESGTPATVTIPIGNYNRISLKNVVTGLLNSASPNGWTYTISIDSSNVSEDTGKYTFTSSSAGSSIQFDPLNNVHSLLGFRSGSLNTFVGVGPYILVSDYVCKLYKDDVIYIHSDLVDDHKQILQEVYSSDQPGYSNVSFHNYAIKEYSKTIRNSNTSYRFWLSNGRERLNLNGLPWRMTIVLYWEDNTNELFRDYMKIGLLKNGK